MPSPAPTDAHSPASRGLADDPPTEDRWPADLGTLRAELDRIDDAIHDLLMQRAEVVARVGATAGKANGRVALRPGREAAIIRRLLARHRGALPPQTLARLWRELLAATTAMQARFVIAVCDTDPAYGYIQAAREQFGVLTPLHVLRTPAAAIEAVAKGTASVAVLPMPSNAEVWWTALLSADHVGLHVVGRLPFWAVRPEGAPRVQALVVAAIPPDPSGDDRSLILLDLEGATDNAWLGTALAAAGFDAAAVVGQAARGDPPPLAGEDRGGVNPSGMHHAALVDVAGFVTEHDGRLARLRENVHRARILGAYAVPVGGPEA